MKKYIIAVGDAQVRVEANWRAITRFLQDVGRDTLQGLSDLAKLPPSDLAPLMAACINEGERLEGREASYTGEWLEENCGLAEISAFTAAFLEQITPKLPQEKEKKD